MEALTSCLHINYPICSVGLLLSLHTLGRAQGSFAESKARISQVGKVTGLEWEFC